MNKAKRLFLKATLMMEGASYLVLIPLAVYVVFFHGNLLGEKFKYSGAGLVIALVITLTHGLLIRYFGFYKPMKLIYTESSLREKELHDIKVKLLNYPLKEALSATIRWIYGAAFVIVFTNLYVPLDVSTYITGIAALLQSVFINFINNYFIAERLISDVLEEPSLSEIIVEAGEYKEFSLIKKTVITVVGIALSIYIVVSYLTLASTNGTIPQSQILTHYALITIMLTLLLLLTIYMFNYSNKKSLNKIKASIEKMSKGELTADLSMTSIDELGRVCSDLHKLKGSLREITAFISSEIKNLHEHSELLSSQNKVIASGPALEEKLGQFKSDNLFGVTDALGHITNILRKMIKLNGRQSFILEGRVKLNSTIQNVQSLSGLARDVIKSLAEHANAMVGTLYVLEDDNTLRLAGSFAHSQRGNIAEKFNLGEGAVGQAAVDKKVNVIDKIPEYELTIDTGILEIVPKNIIIVPCVYKDATKAVVVLGSIHTFEDIHVEFFKTIGVTIAMHISSHQASEAKERLLIQTQQLAEELREQQEELLENNAEIEQMNEELEQQAQELRKSEALLESQQQELKAVNEELRMNSLDIERQRDELNKTNEELRETHRLLEEKAENLEMANQYKSEFLANMSHELRTPLNSIIILSKIMYDNKHNTLSGKEIEYSETIYRAANDLLELINEILDLAKVEAGMMDVNLEKINLSHFAEDITMAFKEVAAAKDLNFSVEVESDLMDTIETDSQRLKQIVRNLLSNAFKFTHQGFVTMRIYKVINEDIKGRGENLVAFSISDSGIGISQEKQKLIFKEFSQADGAINRKYGGTGLGLSISEKFAKLIGGKIQLSSKENQGSTFTLIVPQKNEVQLYNNLDKPKDIDKSLSPVSNKEVKKNKKLLIIDDDINFVRVVTDIARDRGFMCLSALEGEKGLELAKNFSPDAIILDIKLPGIDGWEVMKQLNEDEATKNIPVHFISSLDASPRAMKTGALGYTTKPVTAQKFEELFAGINNSLEGTAPAEGNKDKMLLLIQEQLKENSVIEQIERENISYLRAADFQEAGLILNNKNVNSVLIDFSLEMDKVLAFLRNLKENEETAYLPIIVYSDETISWQEQEKLQKYAESIIIKDGDSQKRLMNEITLFLHHIDNQSPKHYKMEDRPVNKVGLLTDKRILVVDDDMRNIFALTSILENNGLNVVFAKNGKEGLNKLKEGNIDLILMDIMMPEMDGYQTMREIRKMAEYNTIPIIALTAKAMKGDKQRCFEAGANDYMSKPVDTDKLISLVKVWLQR